MCPLGQGTLGEKIVPGFGGGPFCACARLFLGLGWPVLHMRAIVPGFGGWPVLHMRANLSPRAEG